MKVFKVRDKTTGLFSKGGISKRFDEKGKIWHTVGTVRGHLAMFQDKDYRTRTSVYPPRVKNLEVVEFELVEVAKHEVEDFHPPKY
ncbi:hypothetical protein C0Q88_07470 [Ralstonia pickettii]|uniref:Uncharacterized protein n=1 Tax=Ralstonia pickettii TaxID=329 RepID=A0A2N4TXT5_RALPI|nr:hypothetical protein [Ralstonia pickettii]PLC44510.1 hypothetical protein C0Q88_07470 [Ralstonia pickettii]